MQKQMQKLVFWKKQEDNYETSSNFVKDILKKKFKKLIKNYYPIYITRYKYLIIFFDLIVN